MWRGKARGLSFLKIWGCEAYVKRLISDKLAPKSDKEKEFLSKIKSGRKIELHEVREPPDHSVTAGIQQEPDTLEAEASLQVNESEVVAIAPHGDILILESGEPETYKEALESEDSCKWLEAMKSEIDSIYENQLWDLVDMPDNIKPIKHKQVYKIKTDMDEKPSVLKARLVGNGFTQIHGVNYEETFSPVAMLKSIGIILVIAAFHDYEIWQMDVKTTFLNGILEEEVYMTQPKGFEDLKNIGKVWKLNKAIYGLKQASRSWNLRFNQVIKEFGFIRNEEEYCVYKKVSGSKIAFLVLYVDDILFIGNDIPMLESVKTYLGNNFSMKDLGEAQYILGIKIYRDRPRILIGLSQSTYIDKVLAKFNMQNSKKGFVPMSHGISLSKTQSPSTPGFNPTLERNIGLQSAAKNILKYLHITTEKFLVYGEENELVVKGYTDAKAEYIAASEAAKEVVWIKKFITELGVVLSIDNPVDLYCDNNGAIAKA
ncbi:retrovirus-related Pol polyprotein from transposon TNT 1-94 [Beta vulgaris subsp. vulgaris]|uniref:retrovirus-related Pol polyprotein from transposon TNT 1-94 n=1 Tax=Beta vulgaris subsp. vulgaris TaxID=3555 RepID=UPI0020373B18|nr:retrovirus-related Pol polyprotein from transposon TNT 1-94 [Beta vulgaris subsp. vulgaris]